MQLLNKQVQGSIGRRTAAVGANTNSTSSCVDGHLWSTKDDKGRVNKTGDHQRHGNARKQTY